MNATKQQVMAELTAAIQKKWGSQVIRRGSEVAATASLSRLSTGFLKLDALLQGGITRAEITEFCGIQTSGTATLALKTIASTQALGEKVIYIDPSLVFNAKYAHTLNVDLRDLLIVRPASPTEGMEIAADLVHHYSPSVVVFGHTLSAKEEGHQAALRRLVNAVRRSSCAFVVVNRAPAPSTSPFHLYAATRLQLERHKWLSRWGTVGGYLVRVSVVKLNGGDCNRSTMLRFDLP